MNILNIRDQQIDHSPIKQQKQIKLGKHLKSAVRCFEEIFVDLFLILFEVFFY